MKRLFKLTSAAILIIGLVGFTSACGKSSPKGETGDKPGQAVQPGHKVDMELQKEADAFLAKYLSEYERIWLALTTSYWNATNSGKAEYFKALNAANMEAGQLHSDSQGFAKVEKLLAGKDHLKPLTARTLQLAELEFKGNQLPKEMLEKISTIATGIEQLFSNFRAKIDGKEYSNNQLIGMLKEETDSSKRQKIWEALKQVGAAAAPKVVELAKIRNEAARKLGYKNFWDMQIRLQEHDPEEILSIFAQLKKMTEEPFKQMKTKLDQELAARFKIKPEEMMPWHYDNPFFQEPPPLKIDLDEFYKNKTSKEIIDIAKRFYADIGLSIDDIVERSDLYERKGKQPYAYCANIDRKGDIRVQLNIKPNFYWMKTVLHEMGHGVYYKGIDAGLPFNMRDAAHTFTTEAVAKLFGRLAQNPVWLVTYAGADEKRVQEVKEAIREQRRRRQLIFARWSLVMLYFEKSLYENPDQDLNTLWWDMVEKYQMLKRPGDRHAPDWASKIHLANAPVTYHNYQLGELLAAQIRATLVKLAKHEGPASTLNYAGHKVFGDFFKEKIFKPGMTYSWPEFIKNATGEPLTAKYFAEELK